MFDSPYEQPSYFDNMPDTLSIDKWQKIVNVITKIFGAPGAWVMQENVKGMEALIACESIQDQFPAGSKFTRDTNIYCKKVIQTQLKFLTQDDERLGTPSFSTGHKVFSQLNDVTIDKLLTETDQLMYKNKQLMKATC